MHFHDNEVKISSKTTAIHSSVIGNNFDLSTFFWMMIFEHIFPMEIFLTFYQYLEIPFIVDECDPNISQIEFVKCKNVKNEQHTFSLLTFHFIWVFFLQIFASAFINLQQFECEMVTIIMALLRTISNQIRKFLARIR